jgi:transglutaminase-like putative cysteine protease
MASFAIAVCPTRLSLRLSNTLEDLLGSRYCETDRLSEAAWSLFQKS